MIRAAAAALAALALCTAPATACPKPAPDLLHHSCWGPGRAALLLLPEDPLPAPDAGRWLAVTGGYTGKVPRDGGLPNPVGLFIHDGRVVNPNLARMDGVLVVEPAAGALSLWHRRRVRLGSGTYDLTDLDRRRAFARAARASGISVAQSHLLIVDGVLDVRPRAGAPIFPRRVLFTDAHGWGIWREPMPVTLHGAATALAAAYAPRMAFNLDMGSFDYCWRSDGAALTSCGFLGAGATGQLSNLLLVRMPSG